MSEIKTKTTGRIVTPGRKQKPVSSAVKKSYSLRNGEKASEYKESVLLSGKDSKAAKKTKKNPETEIVPGISGTKSFSRLKIKAKSVIGVREKAAEKKKPSKDTAKNEKKSEVKEDTAKSGKVLRVIPLSGIHEIGKNMTLIEYGDDIIAIDCGMAFPDDNMLGIDIVIPDFTYLVQNAKKLKAVFITHAHEDHIGAVPYLLQKLNVPIYGTRLTLGFIRHKLDEFNLKASLMEINPGDKIKIGCFKVEALHITHSVADALCYAIDTPVGKLFHTGDFKVDYTPVDGQTIDFARFAELGKEGIMLLMADSTNASRKGYTPSEKTVGESLKNIFSSIDGRIIIATFSSNVHRVQKIIDIAVETGRKVVISGRSMENMINIAQELGYLKIPANTLVDIKKIKSYNASDLVIITTGSQGEPMSALARMASGEHRDIKVVKGDTVILSSTPVPGNEKSVSNVVNALLAKGAKVIYNDIAETHVSGHACAEEIKLIHALLKPVYFMPVHGEVKHMNAHADIARSMGMDDKHILMAENGNVFEFSGGRVKKSEEKISASAIMVDGYGVGDVGAAVLNERKNLSEAGIVVIVVAFDKQTGMPLDGPEIHTRGFVYVNDYRDFLDEARHYMEETLVFALDEGVRGKQALKDLLRSKMKHFINQKMMRSPIILTVFLEC